MPAGLGPREGRSSALRHHSRGRIGGITATGQYHIRPSHHTVGAVFGNQTMAARSGASSKRRVMAPRRAAKRKFKSKTPDHDSKLNRNLQSNESCGAQAEWYDDQLANLDNSWTK